MAAVAAIAAAADTSFICLSSVCCSSPTNADAAAGGGGGGGGQQISRSCSNKANPCDWPCNLPARIDCDANIRWISSSARRMDAATESCCNMVILRKSCSKVSTRSMRSNVSSLLISNCCCKAVVSWSLSLIFWIKLSNVSSLRSNVSCQVPFSTWCDVRVFSSAFRSSLYCCTLPSVRLSCCCKLDWFSCSVRIDSSWLAIICWICSSCCAACASSFSW